MRAVVTGHSRGLGAAVCAELLQRGARVLALSRGTNVELAGRFGDRLVEFPLDLGEAAALTALIGSSAWASFVRGGGPRLLVNNAGVLAPIAPPGRQGANAIARAVSVNVTAPLLLCDAFVAATSDSADRRVLHVSSGASRSAYAGWSIYCAGKAALDQHARAAAEDAVSGLRVASVAPGVIDTRMQDTIRATGREDFPAREKFEALKRDGLLQRPEDAGRRLVDYLLSDSFGNRPAVDLREL